MMIKSWIEKQPGGEINEKETTSSTSEIHEGKILTYD